MIFRTILFYLPSQKTPATTPFMTPTTCHKGNRKQAG
jgi:hypothetical protein